LEEPGVINKKSDQVNELNFMNN